MSLWGTILNMEKSKFVKCFKDIELNNIIYYAHNPHLRVYNGISNLRVSNGISTIVSNEISTNDFKDFVKDSYYLTTVFNIPRYNKKIPLIIHSCRKENVENSNYFSYYAKFYVLYHSINSTNSISFFSLPLNYKHRSFYLSKGKQNDKNFNLGKQNLKIMDCYRDNNLKFYVPSRLAFDDTVNAISSSVKYKKLINLFTYNGSSTFSSAYDSNFIEWKKKLMNLLSKDNNLK